jgi:hypothetical protein
MDQTLRMNFGWHRKSTAGTGRESSLSEHEDKAEIFYNYIACRRAPGLAQPFGHRKSLAMHYLRTES